MKRKKVNGNGGNGNPTELDRLVSEGAEIVRELHRMERPRLTADAFASMACKIAGTTAEQVEEFGKKLNAAVGCDDTRRFIRKMMLSFGEPTFPAPHHDVPKMLRVFGHPNCVAELLSLDADAGLAQALAAKQAAERFGDRFGQVENWEDHQNRYAELRERLDDIYEQMRRAASAMDFVYDSDGLLPSEKQRGLTRLVFRRAPGLTVDGDLATGDWPRRLVADVERATPAKEPPSTGESEPRHHRKRRRLSSDVTARVVIVEGR